MSVFMILVVKAHARVIFLGWYVRRPYDYSGIQAGRHNGWYQSQADCRLP